MFVPVWLILLLTTWAVLVSFGPVLSEASPKVMHFLSVLSATVGVAFIVWLVLGVSNA